MRSIVMNGTMVGEGSVVAAGVLAKEGVIALPYSLVAGVPGVIKKTFTLGERPQENSDEIYTSDAHAYVEAKIIG